MPVLSHDTSGCPCGLQAVACTGWPPPEPLPNSFTTIPLSTCRAARHGTSAMLWYVCSLDRPDRQGKARSCRSVCLLARLARLSALRPNRRVSSRAAVLQVRQPCQAVSFCLRRHPPPHVPRRHAVSCSSHRDQHFTSMQQHHEGEACTLPKHRQRAHAAADGHMRPTPSTHILQRQLAVTAGLPGRLGLCQLVVLCTCLACQCWSSARMVASDRAARRGGCYNLCHPT